MRRALICVAVVLALCMVLWIGALIFFHCCAPPPQMPVQSLRWPQLPAI
jgi:hypothetical protein